MSTSGITISQLSRDTVINGALRKCQVLQEGQVANTAQAATALEALNTLVPELVSIGMPLWKRSDLDITLVSGQSTYTIGVGQASNTAYPTHILQARRLLPSANSVQEMNIVAGYDFNLLPPDSTGTPVSVSYQPKINLGILSVWPTPDASVPAGTLVKLTYTAPFEVFNAAADTPDFPQEWGNALIYGLAYLLSDEYALSLQDKSWLEKQAEKHLSTALANGQEDGSWYFMIEKRK